MRSSTLFSWLLLISGTLVYGLGFWRACPLLSGKGYFLGVLMTAMFVIYVYLRETLRSQADERFIAVCKMVSLMTAGLFLVGVINAPLVPVERVIYSVALCASLLGLVRVLHASGR